MKTSQPTLFCSPLPDVQRGQVWQLGNHRLMCGDATGKKDVAMLLAGSRPTLVVTSPPYADARDYNDPIPCWDSMMIGAFDGHDFADDVQMLINLGPIHRKNEFIPYWWEWTQSMRNVGWRHAGMYVWDKLYACPGNANSKPRPAHEFIFHFNKKNRPINKTMPCKSIGMAGGAYGLRGKSNTRRSNCKPSKTAEQKVMDSVIRLQCEKVGQTGHPAVFPIGLPRQLLAAYKSSDDTCFDPFTGSGTTLLACEQEGVTGLGMEISPEYVQMAIDRWRKLYPEQVVRLCK